MPDGVAIVTLQLTLDEDGRVAEARALELTVTGALADARGDDVRWVFAEAAASAANGWVYEAPAKAPVTFMANVVIRPEGAERREDAPAADSRIA